MHLVRLEKDSPATVHVSGPGTRCCSGRAGAIFRVLEGCGRHGDNASSGGYPGDRPDILGFGFPGRYYAKSCSIRTPRGVAENRSMFQRCLFCHQPFPEHEGLGPLPAGRRIAYDPERGRLWVICGNCHRWNLLPIEGRAEAIWRLERVARDRGRQVASTEHISLLSADDLLLLRVGEAGLGERAWWRYSRQLRRRREAFESRGSRVSALTYGAVALVGESMGLLDLGLTWDRTMFAEVMRWRHYGTTAWYGRLRCPHCRSVLRVLRFDLSWWLYPRTGPDGELVVGIPCPRCDPWTPDNVFTLQGPEALNVLRRALAYQHISGAPEGLIGEAVQRIEEAGSPVAFAHQMSTGRQSLWKMGKLGSVALEIALNDVFDLRLLEMEVRDLELLWRREEQLARIVDEELTPRWMLERHLRRLPRRPEVVSEEEDARREPA